VVVGGFFFGLEGSKTFLFVLIAVALLNLSVAPVLKILGMKQSKIVFVFFSFLLTSLTFYILPMFVNGFQIVETELARLRILGFVLPSTHLGAIEASLVSGLLVAVIYHFFEWLCDKK
jgi:uncharacterized membrane protein YvlD (DUF360 family)